MFKLFRRLSPMTSKSKKRQKCEERTNIDEKGENVPSYDELRNRFEGMVKHEGDLSMSGTRKRIYSDPRDLRSALVCELKHQLRKRASSV